MKPDWTLWPGCREVRLDHAVWLPLGFAPDFPRKVTKVEIVKISDEFGDKFNGRLDAANQCWSEQVTHPENRRAVGYDHANRCLIVNLGKFGTFCDSMKWNIPDEFPRDEPSITELEAAKARIADLERQIEALPRKDSTPHLAILKDAIAEYFDPRPDIDVSSDVVVPWILERMKSSGMTESKNIADAIFTIVKPLDHDPRKRRG